MTEVELREKIGDELCATIREINPQEIEKMVEMILSANKIYLYGGGRSGLMMRAFAMRLAQMGLRVFYVGDVTALSIGENDLLILGSGKARTVTSKYYAEKAHEKGAKVGLLTANPEGEIAKIADAVVTIFAPVGPDDPRPERKSVQIMGNRFEQSLLIVADYIVMNCVKESNCDMKVMYRNHANLE